MALMDASWDELTSQYKESCMKGIIRCFKAVGDPRNAQAVANIIYSLGLQGASWEQCGSDFEAAVAIAIPFYGSHLLNQEISNLIYG